MLGYADSSAEKCFVADDATLKGAASSGNLNRKGRQAATMSIEQ